MHSWRAYWFSKWHQRELSYCETQATSFSVWKIIWLVLLSWTATPFTRQRIPRLWTSVWPEILLVLMIKYNICLSFWYFCIFHVTFESCSGNQCWPEWTKRVKCFSQQPLLCHCASSANHEHSRRSLQWNLPHRKGPPLPDTNRQNQVRSNTCPATRTLNYTLNKSISLYWLAYEIVPKIFRNGVVYWNWAKSKQDACFFFI